MKDTQLKVIIADSNVQDRGKQTAFNGIKRNGSDIVDR